MPDQSTTSSLKSNSKMEIVKLANHTYLRLGTFLSLALVIQAPGWHNPIHAWGLTNSVTQPLSKVKQGWGSAPQKPRSTLLPRIFNLLAFSTQPQTVNSASQQTDHLQSLTPGTSLTKLAQIDIDHHSPVTDNQSLVKPPSLIHQVKPGDTINKIANKYQVSQEDLIELNQIQNSNIIFVDQRLKIPPNQGIGGGLDADYQGIPNAAKTLSPSTDKANSSSFSEPSLKQKNTLVAPEEDPYIANLRADIDRLRAQYREEKAAGGSINSNLDSVSSISRGDQSAPTSTTTFNSASVPGNLLGSKLKRDAIALVLPPLSNSEEYLPNAFDGYIWPAEGVLTSGYGWRWGRLHRGIDIAAPIGTPIVAAAPGEVIGAGWHGGYGNLIKLEHLDGSVTVYAHNNRILVSHGQRVKQGEQIAEMGSTGNSTGSHLHFEIHLRNQEVANPLALLGSR